jgi:hypothetical protein
MGSHANTRLGLKQPDLGRMLLQVDVRRPKAGGNGLPVTALKERLEGIGRS